MIIARLAGTTTIRRHSSSRSSTVGVVAVVAARLWLEVTSDSPNLGLPKPKIPKPRTYVAQV